MASWGKRIKCIPGIRHWPALKQLRSRIKRNEEKRKKTARTKKVLRDDRRAFIKKSIWFGLEAAATVLIVPVGWSIYRRVSRPPELPSLRQKEVDVDRPSLRRKKEVIRSIRPALEEIFVSLFPKFKDLRSFFSSYVRIVHVSEAHLYLKDGNITNQEISLSALKKRLREHSAIMVWEIDAKSGRLKDLTVIVRDDVFENPLQLFLVLMHEYCHILQIGYNLDFKPLFKKLGVEINKKNMRILAEIETYAWFFHHFNNGIIQRLFKAQLAKRRQNKILQKMDRDFAREANLFLNREKAEAIKWIMKLPVDARGKAFRYVFP